MGALASLISFQPELLSTINVIFGPRIGGLPVVSIACALFALIVIIGFIMARQHEWKPSAIILTAAAIAWLPLFFQGSFSSLREFNDTWFMVGAPEREQVIWRYCRIDKYQNLGGSFCALYPFVEKVRKTVPRGASLAIVTNSLVPYFNYYLYDAYRIKNVSEADYIVIYRPQAALDFKDSKLTIIDAGERQELSGIYEPIAVFGMKELIFKKIKE